MRLAIGLAGGSMPALLPPCYCCFRLLRHSASDLHVLRAQETARSACLSLPCYHRRFLLPPLVLTTFTVFDRFLGEISESRSFERSHRPND